MPDLPDLEAIKNVLNRRIGRQRIAAVEVLRPIALRNLTTLTPSEFLVGRTVLRVVRRAKFLRWELGDDRWLAMNFMLAGHLRWAAPTERPLARDYVAITFSDGTQLRYHDPQGMGKLYLTCDLNAIPGYAGLGPDADDPALTDEEFIARLSRSNGEVKGLLTRGAVVGGIGNAYADEILFAAGIYPFRTRPSLSHGELLAL
ncbi:MAG: DNA-formamidopyrimidine glycosylase family protein [Chloroflexota bacterium]